MKKPLDTFEDFKEAWSLLTGRQQAWVKAKAQWERMTCWAIMKEWTVPKTSQLNADGSWKAKADG